jgi:hypothetical protein
MDVSEDKYTISLDGARWRTSTYTNGNGNCVEVASLDGGHIAVRDTKDRTRPALVYTREEWKAFIAGLADGEFDDLTA